MFAKKSRSNSLLESPGIQVPSLPKLQQLAALEAELIDIIGRRHVAIDQDNDIFSRIEQLYIAHLQNHSLGLEMLEKCLRVVGDIDAPVRVRLLYYYAHEMRLRGAAVDEVEPVLLDCFWANLNLKNKLRVGFKSGLVFCQMSQHNCEVEKIISNLIVALEQEVGFKMRDVKKIKSHSINQKHGLQTMKSIYIGSRISHKSTHKSGDNSTPSRLIRLQLLKDLYETYLTGICRVHSQAKRRYYGECLEELRNKLVRQYPGINIENRLNYIEVNQDISFKEFSHLLNGVIPLGHQNSLEVKTEASKTYQGSRSNTKSAFKGHSEYASGSNTNPQSSANSFFKDTRNSTPNNREKVKAESTQNRKSKLRINLKDRSKTKMDAKRSPQPSDQSLRRENQQKIRVSKLIFRQKSENTKGLVLKFQKLQEKQANKVQIKKKKMKSNFMWSDKVQMDSSDKENQLQNIGNNNITTQVDTITPQEVSEPISPKEEETKDIEQQKDKSPSIQDLGDMTSARKIDLIIKQGLEWIQENISHEHLPELSKEGLDSNAALPNNNVSFQSINTYRQGDAKMGSKSAYDESFSDTHHMNTQRPVKIEPSSRESKEETEYKIIIMAEPFENNCENEREDLKKRLSCLQHEQMIKVIKEEVEFTINSMNNSIIQMEIGRLASKQRIETSINLKEQPQEQELLEEVFEEEDVTTNKQPSFMQTVSDEEEQVVDNFDVRDILQNLGDQSPQQDQEQNVLQDEQSQFDQIFFDIIEEFLTQIYLHCLEAISIVEQAKVVMINPLIDDYFNDLYTQVESTPPVKKQQRMISKIAEQFTEEDECEQENNRTFLFKGSEDEYDDKDKDSEMESSSSDQICEKMQNMAPKIMEIFSEEEVQEVINSLNANKTTAKAKEQKGVKVVRLSEQNEYFPEKVEEHIIEIDQNRPRAQTDESNTSNNLRQMSTNRSQKREPTHLSISISYDQNYDTMMEFSKKMEHWLNPQLKISQNEIVFIIHHPHIDKSHQRSYAIDGIKTFRDESYKKIQQKVYSFLKNYDQFEHQTITLSTWDRIVKDMEVLDILPDEIEIKTILLDDNFKNECYQVKFMHRAKNNSVVVECEDRKFKTHAIDIPQNDGILSISKLLIPPNIAVHGEQLFFKHLWVILGQRNIKFKDRYNNSSLHYTFNVYERCEAEPLMFSYAVSNTGNELSMEFTDVGLQIRPKIWNNIDTIIGFCLKQVNRKLIMFNTQDIHAFLRLL